MMILIFWTCFGWIFEFINLVDIKQKPIAMDESPHPAINKSIFAATSYCAHFWDA